MAASLYSVNFDILALIAQRLEFQDVVNLSLTCRRLHELIHEESLCHSVVKSHKGYSLEADEARRKACTYFEAFRRLYKRQASFATASPVSVTEIGYAYSFHLENGVICWFGEKWSLHTFNTRQKQQVPGVPDKQAIRTLQDSLERFTRPNVILEVLSCLNNIVALATFSLDSLVGYQVYFMDFVRGSPRVIAKRSACHKAKVFVRQCHTHIVYGKYCSLPGARRGDLPRWTFEVISLADSTPCPKPPANQIPFTMNCGHRIGIDVQFAIHNQRFYVVTTSPINVWNNGRPDCHFGCLYIPLDNARAEDWRLSRFWRRSLIEGPANDPWTKLQLVPCEKTGVLKIVETRQEWVNRSSTQVRSCYMYSFPEQPSNDEVFPSTSNDDFSCYGSIHHDCDIRRIPINHLRHAGYNLSVGAFIDVGIDQMTGMANPGLRVRVSAASKTPVDLAQSKKNNMTGIGRDEKLIFKSNACRSFMVPFKCTIAWDRLIPYIPKPKDDILCAAVDERSIVLLIGHNDPGLKQLVLISFDPDLGKE